MIAVRSGEPDSLELIKGLYSDGHETKVDYADALRSYQAYISKRSQRVIRGMKLLQLMMGIVTILNAYYEVCLEVESTKSGLERRVEGRDTRIEEGEGRDRRGTRLTKVSDHRGV